MSTNIGPNIVKNQMIMYLDASNIKSFRGEPTINLAPYTDYSNRNYEQIVNASSWGGDSAEVLYYRSGGYNNLPYKKLTKISSGSGGSYLDDNIGIAIEDNKTYTISCWVKSNKNKILNHNYTLCINRANDNTYRIPSSPLTVTTEWVRYSWIYNSGTGHSGNYRTRHIVYDDDDLPLDVYWSGFQIEEKSYSTPYVNGTRGSLLENGGGLIDISNNNNHGELINEPLYDDENGGSILLNGNNNYIMTNYGKNVNPYNNPITISVFIKPNNISTNSIFISTGQNRGNGISSKRLYVSIYNNKWDWGILSSDWGGSSTIADTNWNNITVVVDSISARLYLNGVIIDTKSVNNTFILNDNFWFGVHDNDTNYPFNGKISNVIIYNKSLTQEEIIQNYNMLKIRYK
jgi:hypothetical protein